MVWPFGQPDPPGDKAHHDKANHDKADKRPLSWDSLHEERLPLAAAKQWAPIVLSSLVGLGALQLYANYLRRIPGAAFIQPKFFRHRSLFGRVTSVGDGDNFHLFHTPGGRAVGWGWLRRIPSKRKDLQGRTIPIRLAGVDAPEGAHFGQPGQLYAPEALKWLQDYIQHKDVRAYIYKKDQYDRIVATVYVRKWLMRRNVGLEMVKRGLATTYEAKTGAEFDGLKEVYERAEAQAKKKRIGMWSGKPSKFESPRQYKTKWAAKKKQGEGG